MNIKSLILSACLAVIPAMAGKIVTYTATSTISQEDANNSAIAGVAKQVKSQITATQTLTKEPKTMSRVTLFSKASRSFP